MTSDEGETNGERPNRSRMALPAEYDEPLDVEGHSLTANEVIDHLGQWLTDERKRKISSVVQHRTYSVCTVLDGIYDRGNTSAVIRSAEALGFQAMHVIETQEHFKEANRVTQGTDKWLDIERWGQPRPCLDQLRNQGYRLVATDLDADASLTDLSFDEPTALIFGNEKDGISETTREMADQRVIIPMVGFAQSFNISVSAALGLWQAFQIRGGEAGQGDLTDRELRVLRARYYLKSLNRPGELVDGLKNRGEL